MRINTNHWNKIRYTVFSPVYDLVAMWFSKYRKISIEQLDVQLGEKVLIVGAGTGLDLKFISKDADITATDITPAMLNKLVEQGMQLGLKVDARVMDGQQLQFPDAAFDKIILHLILAVIPDPVACIKEAERVLKPGGKIAVFDKFLPENERAGAAREILNIITGFFATEINRRFEDIISHTRLQVVKKAQADFNRNFRIFLLEKKIE